MSDDSDSEQEDAGTKEPLKQLHRSNSITHKEQLAYLTRPLTPVKKGPRKSVKQNKSNRKLRRWENCAA